MSTRSIHEGRPVLDLVEEAVHAMRGASPAAAAAFLCGTVPFVLGLLFFLADMSRSPFAADRCVPASLALAGLYVWMRCWHTVYCRLIHTRVSGINPEPWRMRDIYRLVCVHAALSPVSLLLLIACGVVVFPIAWGFAFHQNLVAGLIGRVPTVREAWGQAWRQASRWPGQNHGLLAVLGLFGLVVLLNLLVVTIYLPFLLKTLFGLDTPFTQSPWWLLNTTYWGTLFGLFLLCIGPLEKATYTLRCFYGDGLANGQDLLADLAGLARPARQTATVLLLVLSITLGRTGEGRADTTDPDIRPPVTAEAGLDRAELDRSIDRTLRDPSYAWRMPRDALPEPGEDLSLMGRFAEGIGAMFSTLFEAVAKGLEKALEWLVEHLRLREEPSSASRGAMDWPGLMQGLAWVLVAVLLCVLALLALRNVRLRRARTGPVTADVLPEEPDLDDEAVLATQFPEDEWLALACELRGRGELRKALRSCFLGTLARLARFELLTVSRAKSNAEYRGELSRRSRRQPHLSACFDENVLLFERGWYGRHPVTDSDLDIFLANLEHLNPHETS